MNNIPTEINAVHTRRWLDSIHEILDFYIITLQNISNLLVLRPEQKTRVVCIFRCKGGG